ncbi:MAG: hypothetical protein IPF53_14025 [Blastocatellia bacterium]|nr:hypothetical protein [Blastocatellia bacterium]
MIRHERRSPIVRLVLPVALISVFALCVAEPAHGRADDSVRAASSIGGSGNSQTTTTADPPGSANNPVILSNGWFRTATIVALWPSDALAGSTEKLTIVLKDTKDVSHQQVVDLDGKRGTRSFNLGIAPLPTNGYFRKLYFNLPNRDWSVVWYDDPAFKDGDSQRRVTVLFIRPDNPAQLGGGSFTTPIGFTIILTN